MNSETPEELAYKSVAALNTTGLFRPLRGDEIPRSLDGWTIVPMDDENVEG